MAYTYDARYVRSGYVKRVVDGDTVDLIIDLGYGINLTGSDARVRLYGIDTPETFGVKKDSEEYAKGKAATDRMKELLPVGTVIYLHSHKAKRGKYGRYVVVLWKDADAVGDLQQSINAILYLEGHAELYEDEPLELNEG